MSNQTIEIKTSPNDGNKYINIKLEQDFDQIKILSLTLKQQEIYQSFSADYGVVVGRVLSTQGIGIPNAKVNVFIPLSEEDESNEQIKAIYPFKNVTDKRGQKRFNLLSKVKQISKFSGWDENEFGVGYTPPTPNGSQPSKIELLSNKTHIEVYKKYLKYSTTTNESGDYMIFGVPVGQQTIHTDVDFTDIGRFSMSPRFMSKVLGYPNSLFNEDGSKIKKLDNLDKLSNIESQNKTVNVRPFWGDSSIDNQIGITRIDFDVQGEIRPTFSIFGTTLTQAKDSWWGDRILFRLFAGLRNLCISVGKTDELKKDWCQNQSAPCCKGGVDFCFSLALRFWFKGASIQVLKKNINVIPSFDKTFGLRGKCFVQPNINTNQLFDFGVNLRFGLYIVITNILPFLRVQLGNKYCSLTGGKYDMEAIDFIWLGKTCECRVNNAIQSGILSKGGFTDKADLSTHRSGDLSSRLFEIDNNISNILAEQLNQGSNLSQGNANSDIRELESNEYVLLNDNGSFAIEIQCNRTKVVTNDEGRLIEVDKDSEKGVFIGWRGYMLASIDNLDIDNPPTRNRVDRVRLKVPSTRNYNPNGDAFNAWAFEHFYFEAGNIYSVATFMGTRIQNMSCDHEKREEFTFNLTNKEDDKGWEQNTGLVLSVNNNGYLDESDLPPSEQMYDNNEVCIASAVNTNNALNELFGGVDSGSDPDDQAIDGSDDDPFPKSEPSLPNVVLNAESTACATNSSLSDDNIIFNVIEHDSFLNDKQNYIVINEAYDTDPNITLAEINDINSIYYYDENLYKTTFKEKFVECFDPLIGRIFGSNNSSENIQDSNNNLTIKPTFSCIISNIAVTNTSLRDNKCLVYRRYFVVGYIAENDFLIELGKYVGRQDGLILSLKDNTSINNSIPNWITTPSEWSGNVSGYFSALNSVRQDLSLPVLSNLNLLQTEYKNGYYQGYIDSVDAYQDGENNGITYYNNNQVANNYTATPINPKNSLLLNFCSSRPYSLNSIKCGLYKDGYEYGYFFRMGKLRKDVQNTFPTFSANWNTIWIQAYTDGYNS